METRVAVISIIVEDGNSIEALNQRLHGTLYHRADGHSLSEAGH